MVLFGSKYKKLFDEQALLLKQALADIEDWRKLASDQSKQIELNSVAMSEATLELLRSQKENAELAMEVAMLRGRLEDG